MHWKDFCDPYGSSPWGTGPEGSCHCAGDTIPEIMRGLFLQSFTYEFAVSPFGDAIEIDGKREIVELKAPAPNTESEEHLAIEAWRNMKNSMFLYWLTVAPMTTIGSDSIPYRAPTRPDSLTDDKIRDRLKTTSKWLEWRATHLPYAVVKVGKTEYRIHTYIDRKQDLATTYHIQILMTPYVKGSGTN